MHSDRTVHFSADLCVCVYSWIVQCSEHPSTKACPPILPAVFIQFHLDVSEFNGRGLYTGLRLDYKLRLGAPTSAWRAINSAVAEPVVAAQIFGCFRSTCYKPRSNCSNSFAAATKLQRQQQQFNYILRPGHVF